MKWKLEKVDDVFFVVSTDGDRLDGDRLEAGHSKAVAEFALATLNSGVAEREPERNLNPFPAGRWNKPN